MKRLMLLMLVTAFALPATAQITNTPKGAVDENAEKTLKKALQQINNNAVSFTVTMVNKDANKKETARQKADVIYNKGKYRATFGENIIYCDGSATWHWNKDANEVVVNNMSGVEDDLMNPAGIIANYKSNFNAKYIRKEQNGNAIIDLTPKKAKSYYKIRLTINANSGVLQKMVMHNYDSSCGEYNITNYKSGVKTNADDFVFPKAQNPKVEIIDMR